MQFAKRPTRYRELDGLRGAAAFVVVIYHFLCCFAPQYISQFNPGTVPAWVDTPLGLFIHGGFAVSVFFVLSGFVLASSSTKSDTPLWFAVPARWLRLALPATLSTLFAWALLRTMPEAASALFRQLPSPWHAYVHQGAIPNLGNAFIEGMSFHTYHTPGLGSFNNVLWTMKYELLGSVGIYATYSLAPESRRFPVLALLLGAAVILAAPAPYFAFLLGALVFELTQRRIELPSWQFAAIFFFGLLLAIPAPGFADRWQGGSLPRVLRPGDSNSLFGPLGAALLIFALVHSRKLKRPFRTGPLQWLGKISFPLYLVHVPILYTLVSTCVLAYGGFGFDVLAVALAGFLAVTLPLAALAERTLDRPLLRMIATCRRAFAGPQTGTVVEPVTQARPASSAVPETDEGALAA